MKTEPADATAEDARWSAITKSLTRRYSSTPKRKKKKEDGRGDEAGGAGKRVVMRAAKRERN